jgi:hypothetical protein
MAIAAGSVSQGHRHYAVLRELAVAGFAALAYFGIRNLTVGAMDEAFANAARIADLEERIGVDWEQALQRPFLDEQAFVSLFNWIYIWGHWPVIAVTAIALFRARHDRYVLLRNAIFLSGAIGFLFFALFPVAPPRLIDPALVDTVTLHSDAYRALQPPGLTNQYAAFPSLHFGWNLLVGIVVFGLSARFLVRLFAVGMPAAMAYSVVATANHFVLDVVAGAAVVLVGLAVARHLQARRVRTLETREAAVPRSRAAGSRAPRSLPRRAPSRQRPLVRPRRRPVRSGARRG